MRYEHHKIDNFPKNATLWDKIKANVLFALGITKFTWRKPHLRRSDRRKALRIVKPGDVVLVGSHRRLSSWAIHGPVTHAVLYIGRKKIIHAAGDGVTDASFNFLFREYDTMLIVRPRKISKKHIKKIIAYAKSQIGKPFDYDFGEHSQKVYCTKLVFDSFEKSGFDTGMIEAQKNHKELISEAMHPALFLEGNFDVQFHSKSIVHIKGEYFLNHKVYRNRLFEYLHNR